MSTEQVTAIVEGEEYTLDFPDTKKGRIKAVWEIATTRFSPATFDFDDNRPDALIIEFDNEEKETWEVSLIRASATDGEIQKFQVGVERIEPLW